MERGRIFRSRTLSGIDGTTKKFVFKCDLNQCLKVGGFWKPYHCSRAAFEPRAVLPFGNAIALNAWHIVWKWYSITTNFACDSVVKVRKKSECDIHSILNSWDLVVFVSETVQELAKGFYEQRTVTGKLYMLWARSIIMLIYEFKCCGTKYLCAQPFNPKSGLISHINIDIWILKYGIWVSEMRAEYILMCVGQNHIYSFIFWVVIQSWNIHSMNSWSGFGLWFKP